MFTTNNITDCASRNINYVDKKKKKNCGKKAVLTNFCVENSTDRKVYKIHVHIKLRFIRIHIKIQNTICKILVFFGILLA